MCLDKQLRYDKVKIYAKYSILELDYKLSETGNPDDFRVFPLQEESLPDFQTTVLKELVDKKYKIYRIPFLRETQPYINLIAVFKFGKIYFRIRLTHPIVEYLNSNNI